MRTNKALFTSNSDDWASPDYILNYIKMTYGDYFDPCPLYSKIDGLNIEWSTKKINYVNPPFSKISLFINKAIEEHKKGKFIILLIPARTDTKYFEKLFDYGCQFWFITGRLNYNNKGSAPFPSVFIVLKGNYNEIYNINRDYIKTYMDIKY